MTWMNVKAAVPALSHQVTELNQTWYEGHIYIKGFMYVFIDSKLNGKGGSVRWTWTHDHEHMTMMVVLSDGLPYQLQLPLISRMFII